MEAEDAKKLDADLAAWEEKINALKVKEGQEDQNTQVEEQRKLELA